MIGYPVYIIKLEPDDARMFIETLKEGGVSQEPIAISKLPNGRQQFTFLDGLAAQEAAAFTKGAWSTKLMGTWYPVKDISSYYELHDRFGPNDIIMGSCDGVVVLPDVTPRNKVSEIAALTCDAELLYEALGKVFDLPRLDNVMDALRKGNRTSLYMFYDKWKYSLTSQGPRIYFERTWDDLPYQARIVTEYGNHTIKIRLTPFRDAISRINIRFAGGSIYTAGSIIRWIQVLDEGRSEVNGIDILTQDGIHFSTGDYDGPLHIDLWRAPWDTEWQRRYPDLAASIRLSDVM